MRHTCHSLMNLLVSNGGHYVHYVSAIHILKSLPGDDCPVAVRAERPSGQEARELASAPLGTWAPMVPVRLPILSH